MRRTLLLLLCLGVSLPALAKAPPRLTVDPAYNKDDAITEKGKRVVRRASDDDKRAETALELARELGISGDDARPDQQLETTLFGKRLIIGGEAGLGTRFRKNYELVRGSDDDDLTFDPEVKLEAIYLPSPSTVVFTSAKLFAETTPYKQGGGAEAAAGVELSEFWLLKTGLFKTPLAVQLGRQQIQERREWWWDEDLDAVRFHYFGKKVTASAAVAREFGSKTTLGRFDPEDRGIFRYLGNVRWDWADRQQFEFYALHQNDRSGSYRVGDLVRSERVDESDANLTWTGLRARGRVKSKFPGKFYYWADVARVRGKEKSFDLDDFNAAQEIVTDITRRKVGGTAFDAGISLELPFSFKPYVTFGYARGSGDKNRGSGRNRAFRQTGLQNNNGKFRGLSRFRYYGEVLRPELSNIGISTLALGIPIGETRWIETIWHRYRQPVADDRIAGSRLDSDPNGISRKLGDEIDVIFSYRSDSPWEFELTAGAFRAGQAFGSEKGRIASLIEAKLDYNF
jgi:alginate production protein